MPYMAAQLTDEQRLTLATAVYKRRIEKARTDFEHFVKYVWANVSDFEIAWLHKEAIEAYSDETKRFVYWEAPRGHAKSMITIAFAVWCLGRNPSHRIKIVCANDKEARKRLYEIKEQIEKNRALRDCFPHLKKPANAEWNKSRIFVDRDEHMKDPSIEAIGIMSGALGSRATLIVLDDVVDMRNSVLQPSLREQVRNKLFGELVPTLEKEGRIVAVGTPWTLVDVNAIMKESVGWDLVGPHRVGTDKDPYKPIWPSKFTRESLQQLESILGPAEFSRAYRCQALTGDTVPIQQQWIKFYNRHILGDPYKLFCIQVYDLAISQDKEADYFAYCTMLWDKERNYIFIVDAWHDRLTFRNQAKAVVENAQKWAPQEIVIESGGYQGALASYLEEETTVALPIWPFKTRGRSKERRMVEASPLFERGRVFFHPRFDPRNNQDTQIDAPIVTEVISFPYYKTDDLADVVSMGLLCILEMSPELDRDDAGFNRGESGDGIAIRMTTV